MSKLKELRLEKDLTQKQVATELCISESTVCKYEKGERKPNIEILKKYASIFSVTIDELVY
ncbi:MAG: helix-turn-helix domain-containing protein [Clostridia bacterium]|nr:helix-turn-helix domain-containing protein [Clostridia bacterium]